MYKKNLTAIMIMIVLGMQLFINGCTKVPQSSEQEKAGAIISDVCMGLC